MPSHIPQHFPVGPASTRAFIGFKRQGLSDADFYSELAKTFMPGTPYMQAPLGLNAYVPAVLAPSDDEDLPDEVALIVYSSLEQYEHASKTSLRRRLYTHAHVAVFDMEAPGGGGQFPGSAASPDVKGGRHCWHLFDRAVDWQWGHTQLLVGVSPSGSDGDVQALIDHTVARRSALEAAGFNQMIAVGSPRLALLWLHSDDAVDASTCGLLPPGHGVQKRHLTARAHPMPTLEETLDEVVAHDMITFRFGRDLRAHI